MRVRDRTSQSYRCGIFAALSDLRGGHRRRRAKLDELFDRLKTADAAEAGRIEREIWIEWSKSGSPAMDLLLQRGRDAMEVGDIAAGDRAFHRDHRPCARLCRRLERPRHGLFTRRASSGRRLPTSRQVLTLNPRHFGALVRAWHDLGGTGQAGTGAGGLPGRPGYTSRSWKA